MEPQKRVVKTLVTAGNDRVKEWLNSLHDAVGRMAVSQRITRISEGNFGDHRAIGDGVWALRVHYGPGYRVYYGEDGQLIVLLICAGEKKTQRRDIRLAKRLWREYRGEV
ncbi:MAG TPA: addiction module killer protein [Elusimicrobia bacterium]|nr:addiction module killer protein [Elusimicrobiota bacterium]